MPENSTVTFKVKEDKAVASKVSWFVEKLLFRRDSKTLNEVL